MAKPGYYGVARSGGSVPRPPIRRHQFVRNPRKKSYNTAERYAISEKNKGGMGRDGLSVMDLSI